MKGRDLTHTEKMFQSESFQEKNRKTSPYFDMNMKQGMMPMPMGYQMYHNPMYQVNPYMPSYYPQPYYYDQPYYKPTEEGELYPNQTQPLPSNQ